MMKVSFKEIEEAFDFVSFGSPYEHQAFLDQETGQIYYQSEYNEELDELPEDIDDDKYIAIPHKNDLDLGRALVLDFAGEYLPDELSHVQAIFSRKGAYGRYKELLVQKGLLETWYEFESTAEKKALRKWCEACSIDID